MHRTGYALIIGKMSGFKGSTSMLRKDIKDKDSQDKVESKTTTSTKVKGQSKARQCKYLPLPTPSRTLEKRKELLANNHCFSYGEVGH